MMCLIIVNTRLWVGGMGVRVLKDRLGGLMYDQCDQTSIKGGFFGNSLITRLFIILVRLNFIGLIPYVFAPTSHLRFSFGLAFIV